MGIIKNRTKNNNLMKNLLRFAFVIMSFFAFTSFVEAQSLGTTIAVSPQEVRADEVFSVGLTSSDIDLDRATISWYLNGKLGLSGIGKIGFTSKTGAVGTFFIIRAVIEPLSGGSFSKNITVRPQEVDFLWRSYSYVPPFYLGRSLAPSSGFVSITAMPNMADADGNVLNPKNLVYTWSQRGITLGSASGFGRQTIVLENGQIPERLLNLRVSVSSLNKTVEAEESIIIPLTSPRILFYEKLPLEGVLYNNILRDVTFNKKEMVVKAEPYFFSLDDFLNNKLLYTWKIGNKKIDREINQNNNEIVFRSEEEPGSVSMSLEILNDNLPLRIFQQASRELKFNIQ